MKYSDWKSLSDEEKNKIHWRHHPRIRIATIFSTLFAIVFIVFMLRVFQNRRMHVNRKPNEQEAYAMAKVFINEQLKQPATATFPKNTFESDIDTAKNSYTISSTVNAQDSSGKIVKSMWHVKLSYKGGDWASRDSWKLLESSIK